MSDTTRTDDTGTKPHKAGVFDIRNIIGALMGIYGVILTLAGLLGEHEPEKTGGVNANLWTGVALIVVSVVLHRLGAAPADRRAGGVRPSRRRPDAARAPAQAAPGALTDQTPAAPRPG